MKNHIERKSLLGLGMALLSACGPEALEDLGTGDGLQHGAVLAVQRPRVRHATREMDVSVNGMTYSFSTASSSWAVRNFVFNAAGTSATIVFKNHYTGQSCGPAVDNISVAGP
ncbi:hypothetical protein [Archangium sp.]|jgi:hypothetical protein|uniref:hypothetical protein n=1 Tax=Archangium sp. TaxID=1872627 RepID=UPI002ED79D3D